uniref:Uncharacterized protein DDB_G0283697-like isoform X1 n=1 Tax=Saccoglossus kowalevskii TaxID=10224 RepID=A0ABM0M643_SACKO|nr:PREDICTED: uncharacterized protein DDB_G0283697-like isoform X1 [Saccoglossus kowalevskii]
MTAISVNRRTSIVCALLLVALCLVSSTPSFIERPADVIADVGSTVEIICQIANKSDYTVYWQINNRHMHSVLLGVTLNKAYPRFLFSGDREEGEYNLRIQATVLDDAGSYACLVAAPDNDPGKHLQANANLAFGHIIAPIVEVNCDEYFNIRFDNQESNQEGSTVGLTCQSRGGEPLATLELQRNGEAMPGQNRTTGYDETGQTQIVYTSVTWELTYEDKNAHFTCAASHPAWVVDHKVCSFGQSLWLSHKPVVTITPSWKRFEEGDSGTFNCTADADPALHGVPLVL